MRVHTHTRRRGLSRAHERSILPAMSNDHNLSEEQLLSQLHLLDLEQRHLQIEIERARIKDLLLAQQQHKAAAAQPAKPENTPLNVMAPVRPPPLNQQNVKKPEHKPAQHHKSDVDGRRPHHKEFKDSQEQPEWHGHGESKLRTKPCHWFNSSVGCLHGESCRFAHVKSDDIEPREKHQYVPIGHCRAFALKGVCPFGDTCRYQHLELEPSEQPQSHSEEHKPKKAFKNKKFQNSNTPVTQLEKRLFVTILAELQSASGDSWVYCSKHGIAYNHMQNSDESAEPAAYKDVRAAVMADFNVEMSAEEAEARGALVLRLTAKALEQIDTLYL